MKLTTLAISNIKHNMKNYTMYFFSMCFCVFTTFSFLYLAYSDSVYEKLLSSSKYQNMFLGFSIVILVFVLFFLVSSNNSFIRYRKREISTYALFGMDNKRIGMLLFFETMIIGVAALIIGIGLGVFFSKLMEMILLRMVLADYTDVQFNLDINALLITVSTYLGIFCMMGLSGFRTINKFQLVDLFKGDRVSEKRTTGSYILLIISLILIGGGYYLAMSEDVYQVISYMMLVIVMVVLGSYLFYIGGLQKILYLIKRNKNVLYKNARMISISMLSHKARTFATTMGTIAVLVATSVTAMAFGYTLYQSAESNAKELNSFDVWYYADNDGLENSIYELLAEHGNKATDTIKFQRYMSSPEPSDMPEGHTWFYGDDTSSMTYSQSTYNMIAEAAHDSNTQLNVEKGTALVLYPSYYADFEWNNPTFTYGENDYNVEFLKVSNPYTFGGMLTVIFNDSDYHDLLSEGYIASVPNGRELWPFVGINYNNSLGERALAIDLIELMKNSDNVGSYRILYRTYIESMEIFGLVCFIGYFICAVFVLMSVSLLYFKQIAIGTEEVNQYERLRKIGMDKEQEMSVVRKRIAPMFFIPLLMGLIHSVFAMKGADTMIFSNLISGYENTYLQVLKISSVMYLIYSLIYFAFYLITKYKYVRVVAEK